MAIVKHLSNNPGPVNAGEERVLAHLEAALPDSVWLIPNLTIPFALPNTPEEYDIIAVTPDAVFVIEVKDLAQAIEIEEQEMFVGGDQRRNPFLNTQLKAQKLKTHLCKRLDWFQRGGWVAPIVTLARQPQKLRICDAMKDRVVLLDQLSPLLMPRSPLIENFRHDKLRNKHEEIFSAITGGASERIAPLTFGMYHATSKLFSTNNIEVWRARHRLSGAEATLEIYHRPVQLPPTQVESWKNDCTKMLRTAEEIGTSAYIDTPRELFELDNGAVVVVWPYRDPNTLSLFLEQKSQGEVSIDGAIGRKVAAGFAGALAHLHSSGHVAGEIKEHNLFVRPNGFGAITLDKPLPQKDSDTSKDLLWLGHILGRIHNVVPDTRLAEIARTLQHTDVAERPSAALVVAGLLGENFLPQRGQVDLLDRFEKLQEVVKHQYGRTAKALDKNAKRTVCLKYESGRPETSWALREYRALTLPHVASNQHVVAVISGDANADDSYVATEWLDAPTLATLIDSGTLRDPAQALTVTLQLLDVLRVLHPDIAKIKQLLDSSHETLSEEVQNEIGELRNAGIAHNHLAPSNIFVDQQRGIILTDFVRASRFGEIIPDRNFSLWPKNEPRTISSPLADLYAVGALLLRMLTTSESGIDASSASETSLAQKLVDVALRAIHEDPQERFQSAASFLDALTLLKTDAVQIEQSPDILQLQREIEELIAQGKFDEAEKLCPVEWQLTRERIVHKKQLARAQGELLLEISGITLRHVGRRQIPAGVSSQANKHNGGTAEVYQIVDGQGGVVELLDCIASTENGEDRWTMPGTGFGVPDRVSHANRSLRMSVDKKNDYFIMEITQAQLKVDPRHQGQAAKKKVSKEQLSIPLAGQSADEIFRKFGAIGLGTKEELWGETNRHKAYLAVMFDDNSRHIPAVTHFVSRFIPLYAGITATK